MGKPIPKQIGDIDLLSTTNKTDIVSAINENTTSLADIANINIKKYSTIVPPTINTYNVNSDSLQTAIDVLPYSGNIFVPDGTFTITKPIQLYSYQKLTGKSRSSILKLANNANCSMVMLKTTSEQQVEIGNLTLDGNKANQTSAYDVLSIINDFATQYYDSRHHIYNILILNASKDGFHLEGRGESIISDIQMQEITGNGFTINSWDCWFSNLSAGHCGNDGFNINGSNLRFLNCKSWGSDGGYYINTKSSEYTSCEAQDIRLYGFNINNMLNTLNSILVDAVGWNFTTHVAEIDATSIILTENAWDNIINGIVTDRAEFSITGSQSYALENLGGNNRITLTATQLLTDSIKNKDTMNYTNMVNISAKTRALVDKSYKISSNIQIQNSAHNFNGWYLSGSDTTPDYAYIAPIVNKVPQWNSAIRYLVDTTSYSIGSHLISSSNGSYDLGSSTNRFRSIYASSQVDFNNGTDNLTVNYNSVVGKTAPLYLRGGATTSGVFIDSNNHTIYGDGDSLWSLGKTDKRFNNIYLINAPTVTSNRELKKNIKPLSKEDSYIKAKNLQANTYYWKTDLNSEHKKLGFILDELPKEVVNKNGVDLYALIALQGNALSQAINEIELLKNRLNKLEAK
jgi:hypothetical protein